MKSNQNLSSHDAAASPVIGVVLMIAITVVLAAVVYLLVNDLADEEGQAPDLLVSVDDTGPGGNITITEAPAGLDWGNFTTAGAASCTLPEGSVDVGDVIVCAADGAATVTHTPTGRVVIEAEL